MKYTRFFSISFIITILILSTSLPYQVEAQKGGPDVIPGRYIVVLEDGVTPQDVTRGHGVVPEFVYSHALNGFSGPISPVALAKLQQDSRVLHIEQDQKMYVSAQTIPTGIDRIDAESSSPGYSYAGLVTIAIIDTGIDFDHPDLNVVKKVNCVGKNWRSSTCTEGTGDDGHGHGTHVAGTVAAYDNTIGPVGVVPGADLVAIKVLKDNGSGYNSWVIAGVDYVTSTRTNQDQIDDVDVANMSLGGGYSSALNTAVQNSIAEGVVYAVAAGNEISNAANYSPASAPNAITVSAMADFNGQPGGGSIKTYNFSSCTENKDDSFACFSNYGSVVDIMAPGVGIYSTYKNGGYASASGTSMASPHVAGAAAKLIAEGVTSSNVLGELLNNAIPSSDPDYLIIDDDPDNISEPLLYVGNSVTPIADVTDPNISNVDSSVTSDSATITWDTDEPATSLVEYGTNDFYGSSPSDPNYVTSHSIELTGLSSSTYYHFKVTSEDSSTNSASSADTHFTTASPPILDSISVSPVNPSISEGSTQQFTVTGTYSDLTNQVLTADSWESSDTTYGTVDADGLATGILAGSTTIKAIYGTLEDTATLTVTTAPEDPTTVSVSSINYIIYGGKDSSKHLDIIITIIDNFDDPVSGASVSIDLSRGGGVITSGTGTTTTEGTVTFSLKNAASGHYETDVTSVIASGLTFVDDYVDSGFNK